MWCVVFTTRLVSTVSQTRWPVHGTPWEPTLESVPVLLLLMAGSPDLTGDIRDFKYFSLNIIFSSYHRRRRPPYRRRRRKYRKQSPVSESGDHYTSSNYYRESSQRQREHEDRDSYSPSSYYEDRNSYYSDSISGYDTWDSQRYWWCHINSLSGSFLA